MKLLNYSDMIFYKENGVSISGLRYVHLPFGPVPENFDMLMEKMAEDKIAHIEVFYDGGYEKHQVIPDWRCLKEYIINLKIMDHVIFHNIRIKKRVIAKQKQVRLFLTYMRRIYC